MARTIIFKFPAAGEVETDRSETQRKGGHDIDNVVPFPRDWIGPPEDLVPIGSAAGEPLDDDEELGRALGAEAFWGERSASLHEAIEAPYASVDDGAATAPVAAMTPTAAKGREREGVDEVAGPAGVIRRVLHPRFGLPVRASVAAAVGVLAACCVAVGASIDALGAHHSAAKIAAAVKPRGVPGAGDQSMSSGELSRLAVEKAIKRISRGSKARRSRTPHRGSHRRHRTTSRSSAAVSISYTEPASSSVSESPATPTVASGGSTVGSTSTVVSNPSSSSSSDYSSSSASSGAGPVGAGAPFGPGQVSSTSG